MVLFRCSSKVGTRRYFVWRAGAELYSTSLHRPHECGRDVATPPPPSFTPAVMVTRSHGDIEMGFDRRRGERCDRNDVGHTISDQPSNFACRQARERERERYGGHLKTDCYCIRQPLGLEEVAKPSVRGVRVVVPSSSCAASVLVAAAGQSARAVGGA